MENRVEYRTKKSGEWAELTLVGRAGLVAKVDLGDLEALAEYRWGWHPRGVFDHRQGSLLTHVLYPGARQVFFRNRNLLDCRRANMFTDADEAEMIQFRRRFSPTARGVYYDASRGAYIAHYGFRGSYVYGYFPVASFESETAAKGAAEAQRAAFVKMSFQELLAWRARKAPLTETEVWLGEDVAAAVVSRLNYDPHEIALKSFQAGLLASRTLGAAGQDALMDRLGAKGDGKRNGRALAV